ncbi:MAG: AzlC family ABC transporter permease [Corynebacterium sp.]|nr:AzlC family ABC transporter permease [Corynebacterium sp.]
MDTPALDACASQEPVSTAAHSPGTRQIVRETITETAPVWLGMVLVGLGFGILVVEAGFPAWFAPVVSGVVFAGSVEFLLIGMLAAGVPLASIAATTFFTNARHLAYGLTYPLELIEGKGKLFKRFFAIYSLCDESYALAAATPPAKRSGTRIMVTTIGIYAGWVSGSAIGAVAGQSWLPELLGLDFVMTALFLVLAIDAWKQTQNWRIRITALLATGLAAVLAPGQLVVVALSIFAVLAIGQQAYLNRQ